MSDAAMRRKIRKGPNYHRIPEVRARRRQITTLVLLLAILTCVGVSIWLMMRDDPNLPGKGGASARVSTLAVDPLESVKP